MKYFPSFRKSLLNFLVKMVYLKWDKNAILKYKIKYEFYVAINFFQIYFSMVFQCILMSNPVNFFILIIMCADILSEIILHSTLGFGHPLIVIAVAVFEDIFCQKYRKGSPLKCFFDYNSNNKSWLFINTMRIFVSLSLFFTGKT